jgi:citrate lyase subunit alpha / citrate CoA-transferase
VLGPAKPVRWRTGRERTGGERTRPAGRPGHREREGQTPYRGVGGHAPGGGRHAPPIRSSRDYPANGDKRVPDLRTALELAGLRDGMTISTHHHFRNGDRVALMALQTAADMGVGTCAGSRVRRSPVHEPVIDLMRRGVVHHIEGSMNGPLGEFTSRGGMRGGRAALARRPLAGDPGRRGARGHRGHRGAHRRRVRQRRRLARSVGMRLLGFALADSMYADRVIVVTDNLVPFPCIPWQIQGNNVDFVVEVESVGDPSKIVSGTTEITKSPTGSSSPSTSPASCATRASCGTASPSRRAPAASPWPSSPT